MIRLITILTLLTHVLFLSAQNDVRKIILEQVHDTVKYKKAGQYLLNIKDSITAEDYLNEMALYYFNIADTSKSSNQAFAQFFADFLDLQGYPNHFQSADKIYQKLKTKLIRDGNISLYINFSNEFALAVKSREPYRALDILDECINLPNADNYLVEVSTSINYKGLIQKELGNYKEAIALYFSALKAKEKTNDLTGLGTVLNNLGVIYYIQKNKIRSIQYFEKAVAIQEKAKNTDALIANYTNLGVIYNDDKNFFKSNFYLRKALIIAQEKQKVRRVAAIFNQLGNLFSSQNILDSSIYYYSNALEIFKSKKESVGMATSLHGLARVYLKKNNINQAEKSALEAYRLFGSTSQPNVLMEVTGTLTKIFESKKDYTNALYYRKENNIYRNKIAGEKFNREEIIQKLNYDHEKELSDVKKQNLMEKYLHNERVAFQKKLLLFFALFFIICVVLLLLIYSRYKIIEKQKKNIETQKVSLKQRNDQLSESLEYAAYMQKVIMPTREKFLSDLPNSFLLFKPKEFVSGDFFWSFRINSEVSIAVVADSTAHGVPGALMSLMGNFLLNKIVHKEKIQEPAKILESLKKYLNRYIHPEQYHEGMNMAVLKYNISDNSFKYSGAYLDMWIAGNNEARKLPGSKRHLGYGDDNDDYFFEYKDQLAIGETLYFYSYKSPENLESSTTNDINHRLISFLKQHSNETIQQQYYLLNEEINNRISQHLQLDDICIAACKHSK